MTEEIWKPVVGYEGLYEVSSYGRVRSLDRYVKYSNGPIHLHKGRILNPGKEKVGYLVVPLSCNGKLHLKKIHILVAEAFIPNPDNLPQVNHKDENKTNNNVDNLEWCTAKYNMNYGSIQERHRNTMLERGYSTGLSKEEYHKKWLENNKDYYKKWLENNKDYHKKYCEKNKEKLKDYYHQYYLKRKAGL